MLALIRSRPVRAAALLAAAASLAVFSPTLPAQEPAAPQEDYWAPVRRLVGSWEGTGEGRWGRSSVRRTYEFVLADSFLFARNASDYPPQEANPKGEQHEDWAIFSFDRARKTLMMREFHNESIVNTYVVEHIGDDGTIVLVTEHIENFIPGWRARQTYRFPSPDAFEEVFEMAPPDKEYRIYLTNTFRRAASAR